MELMGEEVGHRGRRGPPFIQKDPIQLLPPKQPRRGRYYRRGQRYYRWTQLYYRSPLRYYRPAKEGLKIEEGLAQRGTVGQAQRGTAAVAGRYYRSRRYYCTYNRFKCRSTRHEKCPPRVEAVVARYRSGTAVEDPQAVRPRGTVILPLGPKTAQTTENQTSNDAGRPRGCETKVYVMIPP